MQHRQMAWLEVREGDQKILHLRADTGRWVPYYSCPQYCRPDVRLPGASKGYPTMQALLKAGWTLVGSEEATLVLTSS
jgi:hypothetical protein